MKPYRFPSILVDSIVIAVIAVVIAFVIPLTGVCAGNNLVIKASADTYVSSKNPNRNFGKANKLYTDGAPSLRSYARFKVAGLKGAKIASAKLRIYVMYNTNSPLVVSKVASNTWSEIKITYNTAPALGETIGKAVRGKNNHWADLDVTSTVTGEGLYSFAWSSDVDVASTLRSREYPIYAPRLVLTLASAEPTVAPTKPTATTNPNPQSPTATRPAPTATRVVPTATRKAPTATPTSAIQFKTLLPGSKLPSDAECAALVRVRPENKADNMTPNATVGNQRLPADFFSGDDPLANSYIAPRVTGNYTGSTDMILQWAACKWGINEDIVRAQATIESSWRMYDQGDWTKDASRCAPGHGLGVDGKAGYCPQSYGILQVKYIYNKSAWPGIYDSTAFNVDVAYARWRACYEGYETWLNGSGPTKYVAGDAWGCVGRWYAGAWRTQPALDYITKVKDIINRRAWEAPDFKEP